MASPPPTEADVTSVLAGVIDPELGSDIVDLGMVRAVAVDGPAVTVTVALTTAGCPLRGQIQRDVKTRVLAMAGIDEVHIDWGEMTQDEKAAAMDRARANIAAREEDTAVPLTAKVVTVASGKGGVGKSSVTVNLAAALADRGFTVGVLDADVWGFSVPRMLGVGGRLAAEMVGDGRKVMIPHERVVGPGVLRIVSMGFLVEEEDTALMWRGLMLNRGVQHFLQDVKWGDLDYLLIDMPPGTGDVQMGVAKLVPRAEVLVVTTPAKAAQKVAIRAVDMARKNFLRVAGVIENMSAFTCDHGDEYALFGSGGGQALADDAGVPLLGRVPLETSVAAGGDTGDPVALGEGPAADAFRAIADVVVSEAIPPVDMAGCSARILEAAVAALDG